MAKRYGVMKAPSVRNMGTFWAGPFKGTSRTWPRYARHPGEAHRVRRRSLNAQIGIVFRMLFYCVG